MAHQLLLRGSTWFVRYTVPKTHWQAVGRVLKTPSGVKKDVTRTLGTRDYREAERRRTGAVTQIVSMLDRRLEAAGLRPLTDWTANWADRASGRRATLLDARATPTPHELEHEIDTPHEMALGDIRDDCEKMERSRGMVAANAYNAAVMGGGKTVGELKDDWLASEEKNGASPKALAGHRAVCALFERFLSEKHSLPTLDAVPFSSVTRKTAHGFVEWRMSMPSPKRLGETISAAATRREVSSMQGLWRRARSREETGLDPWKEVAPKLPKSQDEDGKKRAYTLPELLALFRAPPEAWAPNGSPYGAALRDAARLAVLTGCRMGDLGGLKLRDVEGAAEALRVRRGKTVNASRVVPLGPTARAVLQARLAKLPADSAPGASLWPEVPSETQGKLMSSRFPAIRRRILEDAGIPHDGHEIDFHSLRRSFATFARDAMNEGGAVTDVLLGALMGHEERTLALRVYAPGNLARHLQAAAHDVERIGFPPELLVALRV